MTPERWQQVDRLLEQALEQEPDRRGAFLDRACQGDTALRQEVESLLSAHGKAVGFTEAGPMQTLEKRTRVEEAQLLTGRQIGHYQVLSRLGEGGMGIVYKARDQHLDRFVAIKVLPPELVADPDRKRRFAQEAKAASALNHPSIITIHDIASDNGTDFIVMEYVQGKTLGEVIPRRGLKLNEVLKYAIQIADALAKAHAAGIVHRDLKPGNIMVDEGGLVKVLDFGLAKLTERPQVGEEDSTRSIPPWTDEGTILGTASYMSPEQAAGKPMDARSDIFSFGSVLYEMVTGQRAFQGDSQMSILAAVLNQEPKPASEISRALPRDLEKMISRCLRKEPSRRFQHMADLKVALEELKEESDSGSLRAAETAGLPDKTGRFSTAIWPQVVSRWNMMRLAGALAVLLTVVGVGWFAWRRTESRQEVMQRQLTTNSSETPVTAAAISPDGRYLASADENGLYLRLIDTGERHPLTIPASLKISHVAWFPDGTKLLASGIRENDKIPSLWSVSIFGGPLRKLRDDVAIASVSPDALRIAFVSGNENEIWLAGPNGEEPAKLVTGSKGDRFRCLMWFPQGQRFAYGRNRPGPYALDVESCDLKGGSVTTIVSGVWLNDSCILSDGRLVYSRAELLDRNEASLWGISTDIGTGQAIGKPRRILTWPGVHVGGLSASKDGKRLGFLKKTHQADIFVGELEEGGRRIKVPQRLTFDDRYDFPAAWTPDSRAVIFSSDRNGNLDIFKQTLGQPTAELIMGSLEGEVDPTVSPDGAWILYFALPTPFRLASVNPVYLNRAPISGGPSKIVLNETGFSRVHCARPPSNRCVVDQRNSSEIIFSDFDPMKGKGSELIRIPVNSAVSRYEWSLSPDGSQIAISAAGERENTIRVFSLPGGTSREVAVHGWNRIWGSSWSADGKGWFVGSQSAGSEALLHVDKEGRSRVLWKQPASDAGLWGVPSPDGRYLAFPASTSTSNAWMIENF